MMSRMILRGAVVFQHETVARRRATVDARRVHQTRSGVVSFVISSAFGRDSGPSLDAVRMASNSTKKPLSWK